jgi:hypothetical protein
VSNRIARYFNDESDQDLYEEICQTGWDGMLNHTLEVWFGRFDIRRREVRRFRL